MIAAALLLALQAATGQTEGLIVRAGDREARVPLVETNAGPAVRADRLAPLLDGVVRGEPTGHHELTLAGLRIALVEQVPFARIGGEVVPLAAAPFMDGGVLHVPLHLVADVLPRFAPSLRYDVRRRELLVPYVAIARTEPPAPAVREASVPSAAAPPPSRSAPSRAPPAGTAPDRTATAPPPGARAPANRAADSARTTPAPKPRARHVVVVDAGHGGTDPGMTGPYGSRTKIREKDITLAVAKRLRTELTARGVDVVMTRTTDTLIALSERGRIANRKQGHLFISIHVNAANPRWKSPGAARGFETYFLAEAKTEDAKRVEQMENEAVRFETEAEVARDDPLSFIMNDMAQNEHLRESSVLAEAIQRRLAEIHPAPNRGVKQAGFTVLVSAYMPAVLVEIGFGTNVADAAFVSSPAGQRKIADAVAEAAVEYLAEYERRVHASATP